MEHISQLGSQIREKAAYPDILVISRIFQPQEAVIGEYVYNRCLQDPERIIVLTTGCTGDKTFDQAQEFPVYRWPNFGFSRGILGKFIYAICNTVWTLVLAIKLYFKYHYRYIEWCHGYDFPALLLLSYILPIRFFVYLHGDDLVEIVRNPIWRSLFKITLKRSEGVVCNSSHLQDYLRQYFRLDKPTHVINPVVRPERFGTATSPSHLQDLRLRIRHQYDIPESAVVILSVGRLVKEKSFDRVIDNIPLLLNYGVDVHYLVCGQGPCAQTLKSQAERLRVDNRVHFAGYVSEKELAGYYAACDILAMLTVLEEQQKNLDNFGIVYLEAGYFSKPVIASRTGSVLDVVHHEENGLLVNPESGCDVFQAFYRLCQNPQLREKLGRQGKELAKRRSYHRWLYEPEVGQSCLIN
ncbi:MAG TPA: glycosyltransferase family 4 protein [Nostocaceae cyanobacterium]|nr:glycosyltransferase family 4 protein [Nostocaceae cyanobacterium]